MIPTDLIVAEKPSVAKSFAAALGARWNADNKAYVSQDYTVVHLRGHLLGLKGLRELDASFQRTWDDTTLERLPVFPNLRDSNAYVVKDRSLITVVKKAMESPPIKRVINACDPGREGELLFWEVYNYVGCRKPVLRFWESEALSKEVVLRGLSSLKGSDFYGPRRIMSYARQHADWMMGMNLSTAYTARMGTLWSVGPVQTPTLAMIVHRDQLIELWQPFPYAEINVPFDGFFASVRSPHPKIEDRSYSMSVTDAESFLPMIDKCDYATVAELRKEPTKVLPPKLYSLTTLQIDADKKYGFSASTTLKIAQKLYEDENYKCLSYPRVEGEVIGPSMCEDVTKVAATLGRKYDISYGELHFTDRNVNAKELAETDHHAILPLRSIPETASDTEKKLYFLVVHRFFEAFGLEGMDESISATLSMGEFILEAKRRVQRLSGWRELRAAWETPSSDETDSDELTPALFQLSDRQVLRPRGGATIVHKQLEPPSHYTVGTLLNAMKNIANSVEDVTLRRKLKDIKAGLGTPATRANIIDLLIDRGYIERTKKRLISTPIGRALVDGVLPTLSNYQQRARMEELLNDYEHPEKATEYIEDIKQLVSQGVRHAQSSKRTTSLPKIGLECPKCNHEILDDGRRYRCSQCEFSLPHIYLGHSLDRQTLVDLFTKGETKLLTLTSTQKHKRFQGRITFHEGQLGVTFPTQDDRKLGPCPVCKTGTVYVQGEKRCSCPDCGYFLWRTVAGVTLSQAQLKKLFTKGSISTVKGFKRKNGDTLVPFDAGITLDPQGKIQFLSSRRKPS